MNWAHDGHLHADGPDLSTTLLLGVLVLLAVGYVLLAHRRRQEATGWSRWRTASFLAGTTLLATTLVPSLTPLPPGTFAAHMYQHLMTGMYAPLGLVLGAPLTLILRSVPRRAGRSVSKVLKSTPMTVLAYPWTALTLNLGGLALLYLTPLYEATEQRPMLHHLVHLHFLIAGYLFAYSIAGIDPAPHRPSVPARLVVLGAAIAGHAVLAQLLYAGALQVNVPAADLRAGADLMYYAGDIAELLLALALVHTWRPRRQSPAEHRPRTPAEYRQRPTQHLPAVK